MSITANGQGEKCEEASDIEVRNEPLSPLQKLILLTRTHPPQTASGPGSSERQEAEDLEVGSVYTIYTMRIMFISLTRKHPWPIGACLRVHHNRMSSMYQI